MNVLQLLIGPVTTILDKLIPDPAKKAEAQLELLRLQQAGEFKELDAQLQRDLGQIDVNKAEAASGNAFASSWRPLCGYVCVLGLSYQFVLQPLLAWASGIQAWPLPPELDLGDLITLLGGMLGLGTLRTAERMKGVIPKGK
jgi:hypothetical protein